MYPSHTDYNRDPEESKYNSSTHRDLAYNIDICKSVAQRDVFYVVQDWSACILTQTSSEEITFPTVFSFRVENNFYENSKNISYTYCQWSSASLFIVQVFLRPIHEGCVKLKEILTCVLFQMLVFSVHFSGLLPVVLWLFLDPHPDTQGSFPECYPFHLLCWNHLLELLFLWLDCPRPISWEG